MIERNGYLQKLVDRMNNGMIKVVTGVRRCGKSYLLQEIFYKYLIEHNVQPSHIITLQLDDRLNLKYNIEIQMLYANTFVRKFLMTILFT